MELWQLTGHELRGLLDSREVSSEEVIKAIFARIDACESEFRCYVSTRREMALEEARAVDKLFARGEILGPLAGLPVAVKDNMCVRGEETTCSSAILRGFHPPYDATVVERLRGAHAVIVGKTNMDEFAMGSSTENSCYGPTRNPWASSRTPGGSSGGSAAAVSAGEATLALGSDTGGSIRQPAALCGVVGLKPTYGRVSRYGLVAFASSLDQIGPITRDVRDSAILMNVISGHDRRDSTSIPEPAPDFCDALTEKVRGMVIGVPREYFVGGLDLDVEAAVRGALAEFEEWGARVEEVSLPHTDYAIATYYLVCTAEAGSNLARYDGVRYGYRAPETAASEPGSGDGPIISMFKRTRRDGFGAEVKRRIMLGTYVLSAGYYDAYYLSALKVRSLIRRDFDEVFKRCDCLLTPTSPTPAFKLGEKVDDPLKMYLSDIFTISANLAGIPGMSLPCGMSSEGLPIGLQLLGKPLGESTLFGAACAFEKRSRFRMPQLKGN